MALQNENKNSRLSPTVRTQDNVLKRARIGQGASKVDANGP